MFHNLRPITWSQGPSGSRIATVDGCLVATMRPAADGDVEIHLNALPGGCEKTIVAAANDADRAVRAHVFHAAVLALNAMAGPRPAQPCRGDVVAFVDANGVRREGRIDCDFEPSRGTRGLVVQIGAGDFALVAEADVTIVRRPMD